MNHIQYEKPSTTWFHEITSLIANDKQEKIGSFLSHLPLKSINILFLYWACTRRTSIRH